MFHLIDTRNPTSALLSATYGVFLVTPTVNLKAVHFDVTKKSIIFVLIKLYSIAILGEFLYGFWGLNRYEMYRFVPTFYWTYNRLPYGKNNLSLFEKGRNRPGQISATDWG